MDRRGFRSVFPQRAFFLSLFGNSWTQLGPPMQHPAAARKRTLFSRKKVSKVGGGEPSSTDPYEGIELEDLRSPRSTSHLLVSHFTPLCDCHTNRYVNLRPAARKRYQASSGSQARQQFGQGEGGTGIKLHLDLKCVNSLVKERGHRMAGRREVD